MSQFFVSYHGGRKYASDAEAKAGFEKWNAWLSSLGKAMVNPGTPLVHGRLVSEGGAVAEDSTDDRLTGYSILEASDLDAALDVVKDCPFLEIGTVRVAEMRTMGG